jgi:hypothetical protein
MGELLGFPHELIMKLRITSTTLTNLKIRLIHSKHLSIIYITWIVFRDIYLTMTKLDKLQCMRLIELFVFCRKKFRKR